MRLGACLGQVLCDAQAQEGLLVMAVAVALSARGSSVQVCYLHSKNCVSCAGSPVRNETCLQWQLQRSCMRMTLKGSPICTPSYGHN